MQNMYSNPLLHSEQVRRTSISSLKAQQIVRRTESFWEMINPMAYVVQHHASGFLHSFRVGEGLIQRSFIDEDNLASISNDFVVSPGYKLIVYLEIALFGSNDEAELAGSSQNPKQHFVNSSMKGWSGLMEIEKSTLSFGTSYTLLRDTNLFLFTRNMNVRIRGPVGRWLAS